MGQSISLAHLAPFVQISREKFRKQIQKEAIDTKIALDKEQLEKIVESRVREEINKGVQMIQYQIITLMTTNGQAPFVTVFMYLHEVPEGQTRDDLAMIIEEVLKQRITGVKNEQGVYITPAFPKLIYVLEEDNIKKDSKYWYLTELAAKCTAKRMVPDYISEKVMKSVKEGETFPSMGCRSFLTIDRFSETKGNISKAKNFEEHKGHVYYSRFNQGVVTINLVDAACTSGGDEEKFWKILDERLELCHRALRIRHEHLLGTKSDVAPILWQHGAYARLEKGETIDQLLVGGFSTISLGYAGLYECTMRMKGVSHTDPKGTPFAIAVMQKLNDACNKWKAEENIDYSVYGTPLESTTYKFAKCLQKRWGIIKDVTDHNYITNSYHVCVREHMDAFTKLKFESQFQKLSPDGAISYVEVPNMQNNIPAVLSVMQFIYENKKIKARIKELENKMLKLCESIKTKRMEASVILNEKINKELSELEMKNAKFNAKIIDLAEFTSNGLSYVEFVITTNLGEEEKKLNKIASGGEMSRIMLAIKTVLSDIDEVPVLIFDEIDTGISGKAANSVGVKLKKIAQKHQVLIVTHLASIAAKGEFNYYIYKEVENGKTNTKIKLLDEEDTIKEIARIASGEVTEIAIYHAKELRNKIA